MSDPVSIVRVTMMDGERMVFWATEKARKFEVSHKGRLIVFGPDGLHSFVADAGTWRSAYTDVMPEEPDNV